jgi:hypothetical protein
MTDLFVTINSTVMFHMGLGDNLEKLGMHPFLLWKTSNIYEVCMHSSLWTSVYTSPAATISKS